MRGSLKKSQVICGSCLYQSTNGTGFCKGYLSFLIAFYNAWNCHHRLSQCASQRLFFLLTVSIPIRHNLVYQVLSGQVAYANPLADLAVSTNSKNPRVSWDSNELHLALRAIRNPENPDNLQKAHAQSWHEKPEDVERDGQRDETAVFPFSEYKAKPNLTFFEHTLNLFCWK